MDSDISSSDEDIPVPHPAEALIVRLLAPQRGEAWVQFRKEIYVRQRKRVLLTLKEAQAATDLGPEQILVRINADERLGDLFTSTVESAMRIRWEAKLRALGRVLARGIDADSDTAIDATEVLGRIISELDPPHALALAAIAEAGRFNPGPAAGRDALSEWLTRRFPQMGPVAHHVGAFLIRSGLVTDPFYVNGVLSITALGQLVLDLISDVSPEALDQ